MRRRLAVPLSIVAALAAAPAASATTTISRVGDVVTVTGDDGPSALATTAYFTDVQLQDDLGGPVVAGAGCVQGGPSSVSCGTFGPATRVVATLGGGDDRYKWATIDSAQEVDAGAGNDVVETGNGRDRVLGGPGDDDLNGSRGDDSLDGGDGADVVDGWDGNDTVAGGAGRDVLRGDGATVYANGNDTLLARDGEADSVSCDGAADRAEVDAADVTSGCEQIDAPVVPPPGPTPPGPVVPPGPPAGPTSVGPVVATVAFLPRLGRLRAGRPLTVRLTASVACTARTEIAVTPAVARRAGLGKRVLTLGRSAAVPLRAGRATVVAVRLDRGVRRRLSRAGRVPVVLRTTCTATGLTASTTRIAGTLRR